MKWVAIALGVVGSAVAAVVLIPLAFVVVLAFSLGNAGKTSVSATGGNGGGGTIALGKPVHLGVVSPPSAIVTLDEQVASAPRSSVPCTVPASLLIAQQSQEDDTWDPTRYSPHGNGRGIAQFARSTFAEFAYPIPPGGDNPPTRSDPVNSAYAEARYLCSLGYGTNVHNALVGYNCGNAGPKCQAASSGYASKIISLAERISALPSKTPTIHA